MVSAQALLGDLYHGGHVCKHDNRKSFYWYMKAAKNGNRTAKDQLVYFLYSGIGVNKDLHKSIRYLRQLYYDGEWDIYFRLKFVLE